MDSTCNTLINRIRLETVISEVDTRCRIFALVDGLVFVLISGHVFCDDIFAIILSFWNELWRSSIFHVFFKIDQISHLLFVQFINFISHTKWSTFQYGCLTIWAFKKYWLNWLIIDGVALSFLTFHLCFLLRNLLMLCIFYHFKNKYL